MVAIEFEGILWILIDMQIKISWLNFAYPVLVDIKRSRSYRQEIHRTANRNRCQSEDRYQQDQT